MKKTELDTGFMLIKDTGRLRPQGAAVSSSDSKAFFKSEACEHTFETLIGRHPRKLKEFP